MRDPGFSVRRVQRRGFKESTNNTKDTNASDRAGMFVQFVRLADKKA
jgi:hypothetical protein